jgi:stage II sporulation protein P
METKYPGLARPIHFTSRKYNQHITTGSLLVECGTDANTLDEAKYSAVLLADCISATLKELK